MSDEDQESQGSNLHSAVEVDLITLGSVAYLTLCLTGLVDGKIDLLVHNKSIEQNPTENLFWLRCNGVTQGSR